MHFLKFYQFLIGNKASFLQHYTGEGQEELYSQASLFWDKLDSLSIVFILLFFLIGVLAAWYYANSTSKCKITKCLCKSTPLVLRNSISFLVSH